MKTYAALYNNDDRIFSSSGGLFSAFAKHFDVVYGVSMSEDCYAAVVRRITSIDEIGLLRGSKYIQAKVGESFIDVKRDLDDGKSVLFSGTGCQINGLKRFLGSEYENLLCVDVICHGVPSLVLWKKYVEWREAKIGKIKKVNFRCKEYGWHAFGIKENNEFLYKDEDAFMQMFLKNYSLRPSCYECHAKKLKLSDITIGDFWGIENTFPQMDDGKGTSLVIVRTSKGEKAFENITKELKVKEISYNEGIKCNSCEYQSAYKPKERDSFYLDMNKMSFNELRKKYVKVPFITKVKLRLRSILFKTLKKNT